MSGPKIVRIVTREEVEALCRSDLRAFDTALAQFRRCAEENGVWKGSVEEALQSRRRELQRLFDKERWLDVQKQAPLEVAFLRSEIDRIANEAVSKAELARRTRRRVRDAARSLTVALEAAGKQVPASLADTANKAISASDEQILLMETTLTAALSLLSARSPSASTEEQRALAARLNSGEPHMSYADWLVQHNMQEQESERRLDRLIAEAQVLNPSVAAPFIARAVAIGRESSPARQALLTDSLTLDLAAHISKERAWQRDVAALEDARAILLAAGTAATSELLERLNAAVAAQDPQEAAAVVAATRALEQAEQRRTAAHARRLAVLQGLATLGYEIRENMATAWAKSGRIVVKKPNATDYGVELGAPADADRVQIRLVGAAHPSEPRSAERDRDAEIQWCSQVDSLHAALAARGSELVIERALAAGAQVVKSVAFDDADIRRVEEISKPYRLAGD